MSHRTEQLEATLQRAIGQVIQEGFSDPRIQGMISVTGVSVSADLREAVVSVSVLPAEKAETTLKGLHSARRRIQSELDGKIQTRRMPDLRFELDESLKKQAEVFDVIRDAIADDEARAPEGPEESTGDSAVANEDDSAGTHKQEGGSAS